MVLQVGVRCGPLGAEAEPLSYWLGGAGFCGRAVADLAAALDGDRGWRLTQKHGHQAAQQGAASVGYQLVYEWEGVGEPARWAGAGQMQGRCRAGAGRDA